MLDFSKSFFFTSYIGNNKFVGPWKSVVARFHCTYIRIWSFLFCLMYSHFLTRDALLVGRQTCSLHYRNHSRGETNSQPRRNSPQPIPSCPTPVHLSPYQPPAPHLFPLNPPSTSQSSIPSLPCPHPFLIPP